MGQDKGCAPQVHSAWFWQISGVCLKIVESSRVGRVVFLFANKSGFPKWLVLLVCMSEHQEDATFFATSLAPAFTPVCGSEQLLRAIPS